MIGDSNQYTTQLLPEGSISSVASDQLGPPASVLFLSIRKLLRETAFALFFLAFFEAKVRERVSNNTYNVANLHKPNLLACQEFLFTTNKVAIISSSYFNWRTLSLVI